MLLAPKMQFVYDHDAFNNAVGASAFSTRLVDAVQAKRAAGKSYGGIPVYNLTMADARALESLARKYSIPPEWLANLINHESAGTFNPAVRNPSSGATGLIQFMPSTAKGLGTTTTALSKLTFQQQLPWVEKYLFKTLKNLKAYSCTISSVASTCKIRPDMREIDLYMAIFYPVSMFKPNYQFPSNVVSANGGIRTPMDYYEKVMQHAIFKNTPEHPISGSSQQAQSNKAPLIIGLSIAAVIIVGVGGYLVYRASKSKK